MNQARPEREIQLVVAADEPALFFTSVEAATGYLEVIDVQQGVYSAAYGRGGEPYEIGVSDGRVVICLKMGKPPRPEDLTSLLLGFLLRIGKPARPGDDLSVLLDRCAAHITG
jgi:hypothetical protein